jgi:glycosyltransferase involved in cell wall biosynthesis
VRVLLAHSRYRSAAPSGENKVVDQEAAALVEAGHEVDLYQRDSDEIAGWGIAQRAALPARTVRNGPVRRDLSRRLARLRPDVVHVHNTFPMLSPSVLHACRDAGVPVVATLHNYKLLCASGDYFRDGVPCHDCAGGRVAPAALHGCYRGSRTATLPVVASLTANRSSWQRLVSAYIVISASQRELLRGLGLPTDRVFVKHNFVPAGQPRSGDAEHLVVCVGRLDEAKGLPLLMASWDAFRRRNPDSPLRLAVAGGGPLEDAVRRWAAGHSSVDALGLLPAQEVERLLRRAVAAVVPSQWEETFGLVAVEAMAAGVAPITPARGSFPELVTDGVDGALFAPGDPEALARTLEAVDAAPERFVEYGRRGRATYQQRFARGANVDALVSVYQFAARNPAGGRRAPA